MRIRSAVSRTWSYAGARGHADHHHNPGLRRAAEVTNDLNPGRQPRLELSKGQGAEPSGNQEPCDDDLVAGLWCVIRRD